MQDTMGLRERKRRETRHDLEMATIKLVASNGIKHTTIDMICKASDVSKRTFFNYFDSKEDAVLGLHDIEISQSVLIDHAQRYNSADRIVTINALLFRIIGPSIADPTLRSARLDVIRQDPRLLERQLSRMTYVSKRLQTAIEQLFALEGMSPISTEQAEILLAACGSGLRIAIRQWSATQQPLSLSTLEQQSLTLIREALTAQ